MTSKARLTPDEFRKKLMKKMDDYVFFVYQIVRKFPKDELYGSTSQIKRAALSIILNYIEGYARRKLGIRLNQFETSYGSLKESEYILRFSHKMKWITKVDLDKGLAMSEEIGAMLWSEIQNLDNYVNGR